MQSYYCLQMTIVFLKCNLLLSYKLLRVASMKSLPTARTNSMHKSAFYCLVSNDALNDCIDDIFIIFVKKKCYLIFFLLETGLKFREDNRLKKAKTGSKKRKTEDVAKESKD